MVLSVELQTRCHFCSPERQLVKRLPIVGQKNTGLSPRRNLGLFADSEERRIPPCIAWHRGCRRWSKSLLHNHPDCDGLHGEIVDPLWQLNMRSRASAHPGNATIGENYDFVFLVQFEFLKDCTLDDQSPSQVTQVDATQSPGRTPACQATRPGHHLLSLSPRGYGYSPSRSRSG